jgi:hypothetical protein
MASTATVTAKHGAGVSTTALVLQNVIEFGFDCADTACWIRTPDSTRTFAGYTTVTVVKTGNDFTLTLA